MSLSTKPTKTGRPVRPSARIERAAAKVEHGSPSRLVIETTPDVLRGVKLRAAQEGKTVRAYLLGLLAADGIAAAQANLETVR